MADSLRWGLLATGRIAGSFARGVAHSKTGKLLAAGSRSLEKAQAFAKEHNIPRAYGSYEELLADKDVDAVYISTPHPMHAEWAIKAAEAGKHMLCEKPLTINYPQAQAVIEAARRHDVFLMEAFMYRCHPQIAKLVELLRAGAIGEVRLIKASFSFQAGFSPDSRLFANQLGGGGILDVGCYAASFARLAAGAATGKDFADPLEVKAVGHVGETGVDEWAIAALKFPGEILAQISTGVSLNQDNVAQIFGSEGNILLPTPWIPNREGGQVEIVLKLNKEKEPQRIVLECGDWLYGLEADTVARFIENRQAKNPAMSWDDTLSNMQLLDKWRSQIGQEYDCEKPDKVATVSGRPLAVQPGNKMPYGRIQGIDQPVSRVVMGTAWMPGMPQASAVYDEYFERGGNAFDSAYVYAGGNSERMLGQWIRNRGVRDKVIILDKGAHTPFCTPAHLTRQMMESLDRLGFPSMDIYMMHRDNPDVPVGEFIDVLNEHLRAGRIRAFGGSNWPLERIEQGNEYARQKGLVGFAAVSNNLSLARMVEVPWGGCLSAHDPASRAWFKRTQLPLMPWSSQAQAFYVRGEPGDTSDKNLVRCWYSPDNFQRQARTRELAAKRGVSVMGVALAYLLNQPFPVFPLIGPALLSEVRTSLEGVDVRLSEDELAWLNLEK